MAKNPFKRAKKAGPFTDSLFSTRKTALEENFYRLGSLLQKIKGRKIAIIGQPGAGKSSLLLKLTNGKCDPKPKIGQETDATNWSTDSKQVFFHAYNGSSFVDTPGYGTALHPLKSYKDYFPFQQFDAILFMIKGKVLQSDEEMFRLILDKSSRTCVIFLIRGYSEDVSEEDRQTIEQEFNEKFRHKRYDVPLLFVSNRFGEGIKELQACLEIK